MTNIDTILKNLVKDKRIAIIGPAEYVCKELGEEHGNYIDSFDIVIRLQLLGVPDELQKYYGKRNTIISSSFWTRVKEAYKDKDISWKNATYCQKDYYEKLDDKTLLLECYARNEFNIIYNKLNLKDTMEKKKIYYGNISREMNSMIYAFCNKIGININKTLSTGFMTLILFILLEPKKIYVSGITGHSDRKYNTHFEGYTLDKFSNGAPDGYNDKFHLIDRNKYTLDHPYDEETEILSYCIKNRFIKTDKYLKKLFKNL
jgi:hypothetical protein